MFGKPGQYREEYIRGTGDTLNWFINLKANLRSSIEREKEIEKGQNNG